MRLTKTATITTTVASGGVCWTFINLSLTQYEQLKNKNKNNKNNINNKNSYNKTTSK